MPFSLVIAGLLTAAPAQAWSIQDAETTTRWSVETADARCFLHDGHDAYGVRRWADRFEARTRRTGERPRSATARIRAARKLLCANWYDRMEAHHAASWSNMVNPWIQDRSELVLWLLEDLGGPEHPADEPVGDGLIPADLHALRGFATWQLAQSGGDVRERHHVIELTLATSKAEVESRWAGEAMTTIGDSYGCGGGIYMWVAPLDELPEYRRAAHSPR